MRSELLWFIALCCASSLPHCMHVSDGIELDVAYQPEATPTEIRTDMGYRVRLERAFIAVGQVELVPCDSVASDLWELIGPARARAHELSTPTSLGVPLVLDLMESAGTPIFAGTLRPPPGSYCGIRFTGMPADEDAEGLTEESLDMMRHSVLVAARIEDGASGDEWPVTVGIWEMLPCELPFDEPFVFDRPVLESVAITIDHTAWFDGIDFAAEDAGTVQRQMTDNIRSSLTALRSYGTSGL
ncbi:MAG TPA: hypothetical protein VLS88_10125 [Polyangiales bacterium]|nr:hypothetical protein [Polyangiales bacterium]